MTRDSGSKPVRATTSSGVVHESRGAEGNRPTTGQDRSPIIGDLKPCVFCESSSTDVWNCRTPTRGPAFYVVCRNILCAASGPARDTEADAITAWNTRSPDVVTVMLDDSGIQAAEEAYDNFVREAGYRSPYLNTRAFRLAFEAALLKVALP